jgi:phosphatidylserine decarboxylase
MRRRWTIRLEQFRQARAIHGGLMKMSLAVLGIKLARLPLPSARLRLLLFREFFSRKYPPGLNEQEADRPLTAYRSLNAMFTRGIKPEHRPISSAASQFLAPCDGTVQDLGRIEQGKLLTVKGVTYSLASLLPGIDVRPLEGGQYAIIFLSPIDCHRVFSPQDGLLEKAIHVPGHRLLVHPPFQRPELPVYTLNERMILQLATRQGPCLVVMVAGWGVGNITLPLAPAFRPRARTAGTHLWSPPAPIRRGDWLGTFELGSTVVLLTPPAAGVKTLVRPDETVQYGKPVFTYAG